MTTVLVIIGGLALFAWVTHGSGWGVRPPTLRQKYPHCPDYLLEECDRHHRQQQQATERTLRQIADDARNPNPRWLQRRMAELRGERRER